MMIEEPLSNVSVGPLVSGVAELQVAKQEQVPSLKFIVDATIRGDPAAHSVAHALLSGVCRFGFPAGLDPEHVVSGRGKSTEKTHVSHHSRLFCSQLD